MINNLNWTVIIAVVLIVMLITFMVFCWRIAVGFRKFMIEEIQEAVLGSGEDVAGKLDELMRENKAARNDIMNELNRTASEISQSISSITRHMNFHDIIQLQEDYKSQTGQIISLLGRDNTSGILEAVNRLEEAFHDISDRLSLEPLNQTLQGINAEIDGMNESISNMNNEIKTIYKAVRTLTEKITSADLSKEQKDNIDSLRESISNLAKFSVNLNGVMTSGIGNIESILNMTDDNLRKITQDAVRRIEADYRDNMKILFGAMAKNCEALVNYIKRNKNDS